MPTLRDQAVVLMRLDYSETSQILVFFTAAHGKVRAIAKGVKRSTKKRFAVGIDLLDIGELVISVRQERSESLAILTEWKQTRTLLGLRDRLDRLHAAEYAAEITGFLVEEWDPHEELFHEFVSALRELETSEEPIGAVARYQIRLMDAIGLLPRFDGCVLCGRANDLTHFSSHNGGMICRHCEPTQVEKWEVSPQTLRLLQDQATVGFPIGAFSLLNYHISHLMGREPRLASKLVSPAQRKIVE